LEEGRAVADAGNGSRLPRPPTPASTDLVAKYFRALGDSTRLRIPRAAAGQRGAVGRRLTRRLAQPQPRVSNHLACLRWCGFVATRRDHRVVYYRLADDRVAAILDLAQGLLDDHADNVAACCRIPGRPELWYPPPAQPRGLQPSNGRWWRYWSFPAAQPRRRDRAGRATVRRA
jgi:DNA-binding transcriptional ArsR family regulator